MQQTSSARAHFLLVFYPTAISPHFSYTYKYEGGRKEKGRGKGKEKEEILDRIVVNKEGKGRGERKGRWNLGKEGGRRKRRGNT